MKKKNRKLFLLKKVAQVTAKLTLLKLKTEDKISKWINLILGEV